jgi:hypothetical protein
MTTNTLAAIRERAAAYRKAWFDFAGLNHFDPRFEQARHVLDVERVSAPADRAALLAIVDALTARAEAAEADYRTLAAQVARIDAAGDVQIDDLEVSYGEQADMAQVRLTALMAVATMAGIHDRRVREAADALAAHDANGESAGNGGA